MLSFTLIFLTTFKVGWLFPLRYSLTLDVLIPKSKDKRF